DRGLHLPGGLRQDDPLHLVRGHLVVGHDEVICAKGANPGYRDLSVDKAVVNPHVHDAHEGSNARAIQYLVPYWRGWSRPPRPPALCLPSCHRDFTAGSSSIFAGYRWPAEVILAAVRWYLLPA